MSFSSSPAGVCANERRDDVDESAQSVQAPLAAVPQRMAALRPRSRSDVLDLSLSAADALRLRRDLPFGRPARADAGAHRPATGDGARSRLPQSARGFAAESADAFFRRGRAAMGE